MTANRLADGLVVYLTDGGQWSERIDAARVADGKDEAALLLADAERDVANCRVVAAYLIDVAREPGGAVRLLRFASR